MNIQIYSNILNIELQKTNSCERRISEEFKDKQISREITQGEFNLTSKERIHEEFNIFPAGDVKFKIFNTQGLEIIQNIQIMIHAEYRTYGNLDLCLYPQ